VQIQSKEDGPCPFGGTRRGWTYVGSNRRFQSRRPPDQIQKSPLSSGYSVAADDFLCACDSVHPIEEKAFAQLGEEEEGRSTSKWVVNTDATNHMTGACAAFVELDINVWGMI
jgi:hypothetical protein